VAAAKVARIFALVAIESAVIDGTRETLDVAGFHLPRPGHESTAGIGYGKFAGRRCRRAPGTLRARMLDQLRQSLALCDCLHQPDDC
jgi:hypothetical protein